MKRTRSNPAKPKAPPYPKGFARFLSRDDITDLLVDRGICCEDQPIDFGDAKEMLAWAPKSTRFKLVQINPRDVTDCVMEAKRFKRWPVVVGFGEADEGRKYSVVDGLHRCAVANGRGYETIWAYVPVKEDGKTLHTWESFEAFDRADLRQMHQAAAAHP